MGEQRQQHRCSAGRGSGSHSLPHPVVVAVAVAWAVTDVHSSESDVIRPAPQCLGQAPGCSIHTWPPHPRADAELMQSAFNKSPFSLRYPGLISVACKKNLDGSKILCKNPDAYMCKLQHNASLRLGFGGWVLPLLILTFYCNKT